MISRKIRQLFSVKPFPNSKLRDPNSFLIEECYWIRNILTTVKLSEVSSKMTSVYRFRVILRDLRAVRWGAWSKSYIISSVIKRCRRERGVREVLHCFRQAFMRPRRTLLLSATAAYKKAEDDAPPCEQSISDEDLEKILLELESVDELSRQTLYCEACGKRLVIDRKHVGISYCVCKVSQTQETTDGWEPYMEAEDVIIWRKEQHKGQGLYAYKVYGRYNEVWARDFAAIQADGEYRRSWDSAVAALRVVEERANGVEGQAVLHWEVMWPRMFANRDYVYLRRRKEFAVRTAPTEEPPAPTHADTQRPSVHSRAKRRSQRAERRRGARAHVDNTAYVIVSRSCKHSKVPESKSAVRVTEYWSHMCVRTLRGGDEPGMEFVLTYYDDPGVGSCGAMAAWATGRAAPAYLERMRRAAADYAAWRQRSLSDGKASEEPAPAKEADIPVSLPQAEKSGTAIVEARDKGDDTPHEVVEQNHKQSEDGSEKDAGIDKSTQTEVTSQAVTETVAVAKEKEGASTESPQNTEPEEAPETNGSWWRYLYPFYYFI